MAIRWSAIFKALRAVRDAEGLYAAWEIVREEFSLSIGSLITIVLALPIGFLAMIGGLIESIGWTGTIVAAAGAFTIAHHWLSKARARASSSKNAKNNDLQVSIGKMYKQSEEIRKQIIEVRNQSDQIKEIVSRHDFVMRAQSRLLRVIDVQKILKKQIESFKTTEGLFLNTYKILIFQKMQMIHG